MTFDELSKEAESQGYKLVPIRNSKHKRAIYAKCKDCMYLSMMKTSIGYKCINPTKSFASDTAQFKAKCAKACKLFKQKEGRI